MEYGTPGTWTTSVTVTPCVSSVTSLVGAADFAVNNVAPGGWATIFGNFGGVVTAGATSLPLPAILSGVQVLWSGLPASLRRVLRL